MNLVHLSNVIWVGQRYLVSQVNNSTRLATIATSLLGISLISNHPVVGSIKVTHHRVSVFLPGHCILCAGQSAWHIIFPMVPPPFPWLRGVHLFLRAFSYLACVALAAYMRNVLSQIFHVKCWWIVFSVLVLKDGIVSYDTTMLLLFSGARPV